MLFSHTNYIGKTVKMKLFVMELLISCNRINFYVGYSLFFVN